MTHRAADTWAPPVTALVLYVGLTALIVALGLAQTGRTFVYAQDDPYIHLTIARTFAEHGVWGIRPDEFASASSSPLWTLLLAVLWRTGAQAIWWPLVVNLACGVATILLVDAMLRRTVSGFSRTAILAALIVVTPLPTLAVIGMEHTLQVFLSIAFAWCATRLIVEKEPRSAVVVCLLAVLLVATRYEGLFLVAAASGLLAARRRILPAVMLALAALGPVVAFGIYSVNQGALVLPNSILMKSNPERFATLGDGIAAVLSDWATVFSLFSRPPELVLTLCLLLVLARLWSSATRDDRVLTLCVLSVIGFLLHACLVKLEWFYRYEAAVMALGILALGWVLSRAANRAMLLTPLLASAAGTVLLVLLALPLASRALSAVAATPRAMRNVFDQQYQMANFFRTAYARDAIAVNDIGAIAWLSTSRILDVYGLATQEVADLKRQRRWDRDRLETVAAREHVKAVAMYERVLAPLIPTTWTLVGEWRIAGNVAVSEDTVGFYAPTPEDVPRLRTALEAYAPRLPRSVTYVAR